MLWKAKQKDGLRIIGVNLYEPPERVKSLVTQMKLTFPIVIDATGEVARTYGVRFTPTHFLVDRTGTVRAAGAGGLDWNGPAAQAAVQVLLEAKPSKAATPARRAPAALLTGSTKGEK